MSAPPSKFDLDLAILRSAFDLHDLGIGKAIDEAVGDRWPAKVVWRRMETLELKGYLEFGVSLRYAWPTKRGLQRLDELEDRGSSAR